MAGDRGQEQEGPLDPRTRVGHVHLKVSDLQRAIDFYTLVLGFDVVARMGDQAAFLSAGGYHHHVGLNTWHSQGGSPPSRSNTGLYHVAFLYPSRKALALAIKRLADHSWPIDGAADHGASEAVYLRDPDQNGIELYCDRPREEWPKNPDGTYELRNERLDISSLLAELSSGLSGD